MNSGKYQSSIEEIEDLISIYKQEAEFERNSYISKMEGQNVQERIKLGTTLYPLEILDIEFFVRESWKIILSSKRVKKDFSQFSEGSPVSLFRSEQRKFASISRILENEIIVIVEGDIPDWLEEGLIGMDLFYSEKSYKEGERALRKLIEAEGPKKILRDVLLGYKEQTAQFSKLPTAISISDSLNASQKLAVERMLTSEDCLIIQGPPGTGKTSVLIEGIRNLVSLGAKVLVSTPTNSALDLLLSKTVEIDLKPLRLGQLTRLDERYLPHTLDSKIESHPISKQVDKYRKQANNIRKKAIKHHRNYNAKLAAERREHWDQFYGIKETIKNTERQIEKELIRTHNPILATNVSSSNSILIKEEFDVCIIDEAIQSLEPHAWIPILKSKRVILAGDENQLPPTVLSGNPELMNTLFIKLIQNFKNTDRVVFLDTQYRMEESILNFSNQEFYNGKIQSHPSIALRTKIYSPLFKSSLVFIDTAGTGFEEAQGLESESTMNEGEANFIFNLYKTIEENLEINDSEIGIIAPYREQIKILKELFQSISQGLEINTVDSFQGREKDTIIMSMTRSNDEGEIGFLKDYRRMNVSLTRARKLLVVVGDSTTLQNDPFYERFINYCQKNGDYRSAYEFIIE